MAIQNYTDLKGTFADWLDFDDLNNIDDTLVALAESRISREVRVRDMIKRSVTSTNAGSRYVQLPNGFLEMKRLVLYTNPIRNLKQVTTDQIYGKFARQGVPSCFALHEELELNTAPDSEYELEMIYYAKITPLSDANPTNTILQNHPDLYLYAGLASSESYIGNDERMVVWEQLYNKIRDDINQNHRVGQYKAGPLQAYTDIYTP